MLAKLLSKLICFQVVNQFDTDILKFSMPLPRASVEKFPGGINR